MPIKAVLKIAQLQRLIAQLQEAVLSIEKLEIEVSQKFQDSRQLSSALAHEAADAPMYLRERSARLAALIKKMHLEIDDHRQRLSVLFRQIDKMKDPLLSDFFSPMIEKALERIMANRPEARHAIRQARPLYMLGNVRFAAPGLPLKRIKNISYRDLPRIREMIQAKNFDLSGEPAILDVFPEKPEENYFSSPDSRLDLLLCRLGDGKFLGLWCEKILSVLPDEEEPLEKKAVPVNLNRWITGSVTRGGEKYFLIRNSPLPLEGV